MIGRTMAFVGIGAVLGGLITIGATTTQTVVASFDGLVESTSGGFKFPDGTVQATAARSDPCPTLDPTDEMIWVGGVCVDKYEASIWDAPIGGNQVNGNPPCSPNGHDCNNIWARSVAGVKPNGHASWFQAQRALANSGKRLPTNAEWQMAASGTPDPGASGGTDDCHINDSPFGPVVTGSRVNCVSAFGHYDMVGNLWEWVADWGDKNTGPSAGCTNWASWLPFGEDESCVGLGEGEQNFHLPGALVRGGDYESHEDGGAFAIDASNEPSSWSAKIGFRGAR